MKKLIYIFISILLPAAFGCGPAGGGGQGGANLAQAPSVSFAASAPAAASGPKITPPGLPVPQDIRRILDRGKLIVALYNQDRPPFFSTRPDGTLFGSDIDLAGDLAKQLGVAVEFNRAASTFDGVVGLVANKQADIAVSKLSVTLDRAKSVTFSEPYLLLRQALLINRLALARTHQKGDVLQQIRSSRGKIGVLQGTSFVGYAGSLFSGNPIIVYEDRSKLMEDVRRGELQAVLYDENEIKRYMFDHPDQSIDLQIQMLSDQEDTIAIAVAPDNPNLLAWINAYLELNRVHPTINELIRKYGDQGGE